jgi:hypothetical protein
VKQSRMLGFGPTSIREFLGNFDEFKFIKERQPAVPCFIRVIDGQLIELLSVTKVSQAGLYARRVMSCD